MKSSVALALFFLAFAPSCGDDESSSQIEEQDAPRDLFGQPYNESEQCWEPAVLVGESTPGVGCASVLKVLASPAGECFLFGDCAPEEFVELESCPDADAELPNCPSAAVKPSERNSE